MKQGRDFNEFVTTIEDAAKNKSDVVARMSACRLATDKAGQSVWTIGDLGGFQVTPVFGQDVASHLRIPTSYYDDMRQNYPALLDANVNSWLNVMPEDEYRLMRLYDANESEHGVARAIRSTSYLTLDDSDLIKNLPVMEKGLHVESCELTDRRSFLKLTSTRLKGDVKIGDVVEGGLLISNSEVGAGNIIVAPFIKRLVCLNGLAVAQNGDLAIKRIHRGSALVTHGLPYRRIEVEPLERRDAKREIWRQVGVAVNQVLTGATFEGLMERLKAADKVSVSAKTDTTKLFERIGKRFGLSEAEQAAAVANFETDGGGGGGTSWWNVVNAITATANNETLTYERASAIEQIGGQLLNLPQKDWERLATLN
jgi:hypothetical protein